MAVKLPQDLPPYSGENPTCPKCRQVGAKTVYMARNVCVPGMNGQHILVEESAHLNERLHRQCWNCEYQWDEALALGSEDILTGRQERPTV